MYVAVIVENKITNLRGAGRTWRGLEERERKLCHCILIKNNNWKKD